MRKKEKAQYVLNILGKLYPKLQVHLIHKTAWELLVATVLSAQCTDARVNQVTPALFAKYPDVFAMSKADVRDLEELMHSTGFYKNKSKNILSTANIIVDKFAGQIPSSMDELVKLDGVARKTANVVLWGAFGINAGLAVDTHVARISVRLGLCKDGSPEEIESALCKIFPQKEWGGVNHRMVSFGRDHCMARNPACSTCPMFEFCPTGKKKV